MLLRPGVATTSPCEVVRCSLSPRPDCDPDAKLQATGWGAAPRGGGGSERAATCAAGCGALAGKSAAICAAREKGYWVRSDERRAAQGLESLYALDAQAPQGSARGAVLTCDTARARVALIELTANGIPTLWAHPDAKLPAFTLQVLGWKLIQQNSYK